MKNHVLLIGILSTNLTISFSQHYEPFKNSRQVIVTSGDSVVYTYISTHRKINTKPDNNKTYYWYDVNLIQNNKGGYSGSLLHGPYEVYNISGKLVRKGIMQNGLPNGTWNYWNNQGQLIKTEKWKEGILSKEYIYNNRGNRVKSTDMSKKENTKHLFKKNKQNKESKANSKQSLLKQQNIDSIEHKKEREKPDITAKEKLYKKELFQSIRNFNLKRNIFHSNKKQND